jgi:hypothetical protein
VRRSTEGGGAGSDGGGVVTVQPGATARVTTSGAEKLRRRCFADMRGTYASARGGATACLGLPIVVLVAAAPAS